MIIINLLLSTFICSIIIIITTIQTEQIRFLLLLFSKLVVTFSPMDLEIQP